MNWLRSGQGTSDSFKGHFRTPQADEIKNWRRVIWGKKKIGEKND